MAGLESLSAFILEDKLLSLPCATEEREHEGKSLLECKMVSGQGLTSRS